MFFLKDLLSIQCLQNLTITNIMPVAPDSIRFKVCQANLQPNVNLLYPLHKVFHIQSVILLSIWNLKSWQLCLILNLDTNKNWNLFFSAENVQMTLQSCPLNYCCVTSAQTELYGGQIFYLTR